MPTRLYIQKKTGLHNENDMVLFIHGFGLSRRGDGGQKPREG
jgi:hypothetical protein